MYNEIRMFSLDKGVITMWKDSTDLRMTTWWIRVANCEIKFSTYENSKYYVTAQSKLGDLFPRNAEDTQMCNVCKYMTIKSVKKII